VLFADVLGGLGMEGMPMSVFAWRSARCIGTIHVKSMEIRLVLLQKHDQAKHGMAWKPLFSG